ncbi:MAG TPA: nucleoside triphosphate pyrophosphohydrolase [Anaerolineae bacterium]|nr:nucleoside triphosphate pyrophosphohydrolase [Anaerolineae bacterium]
MVTNPWPDERAITIVGLGPGNPAHLTREAWDLFSHVQEVHLRTTRHPTVGSLPSHLVLHSFDYLYESAADFASVYIQIAEEILSLGRRAGGVVYAVPGHPLIGETSVQHILQLARQEGTAVHLVHGLSFVEPVLSQLGLDGLEGLQLADATDLASRQHPPLDPDRPALVGQLYSQRLAGDVKLTLMNAYPDEHSVRIIQAAGMPDAAVQSVPLYELDRQGVIADHLTTLYVPPLGHAAGLPSLQQTVAQLRAPGGCPWDQEQTHETLRPHLLEECYEVMEALDAGEPAELCEELGDLLMQIAMHVQIATEHGEFHFADVIGQIDAKLRRRHPHVFGDAKVRDTSDVLRNWDAIKREEAHGRAGDSQVPESLLAKVPATLPALARAQALSVRAARAGFEWPDLVGVLDKLAEEVGELAEARDHDAAEAELGDVLFTVVNVARWLGLEAETALRGACTRFAARYAHMERQARQRGVNLADLPMAEQEALWQCAKEGS